MNQTAFRFEDAEAYERFMGRWSRAAATLFLDWLAVEPGATWLDVGCGTGVLAETVLQRCAPRQVHGIDAEEAQLRAAMRGGSARGHFQVGDARQLPFRDGAFDVVASALLLNFVPEPQLALAEMRRAVRAGGLIAAYVWDFPQENSPSGPLRRAMRRSGFEPPPAPGTQFSSLPSLQALFQAAGVQHVETCKINVCLAYRDFQDFWEAQTPGYAPITKIINGMTTSQRLRLMRTVESSLAAGPGGRIEYCASANAIKGCDSAVPGHGRHRRGPPA